MAPAAMRATTAQSFGDEVDAVGHGCSVRVVSMRRYRWGTEWCTARTGHRPVLDPEARPGDTCTSAGVCTRRCPHSRQFREQGIPALSIKRTCPSALRIGSPRRRCRGPPEAALVHGGQDRVNPPRTDHTACTRRTFHLRRAGGAIDLPAVLGRAGHALGGILVQRLKIGHLTEVVSTPGQDPQCGPEGPPAQPRNQGLRAVVVSPRRFCDARPSVMP